MDKPIYLLNLKAQALTELAVFGSIILLLLGILLNYGLRYSHQQRVMQKTFRIAYENATHSGEDNTPRSAQRMILEDIHIPDPQNPFAVGILSPVTSSAGVTVQRANNFPETDEELPTLFIDVNPGPYDPPIVFRLAGRRTEYEITPNQRKKYELIYSYGDLNFVKDPGADEWQAPEWDPIYLHNYCVAQNMTIAPCTYTLNIVDSCDGHILVYDVAIARCRLITDYDACREYCNRDPGMPSSECDSLCAEEIDVPWYCNRGALDQLFAVNSYGGEPRDLGIQPGYQDDTVSDNVLSKTESPGGITTTDTLDWSTTRTRRIIFRAMGDTSGTPQSWPLSSTLYQDNSTSFSTSY